MRVGWAMLLSVTVGCTPRLYTDAVIDTDGPSWEAPENTWPVVPPPEGLVGQGMDEGNTVLDIRGTDQFGDEVSIWQFHERWVLIDISTMWCAPCQDLARGTEEVYQEFKGEGFIYVTMILENLDNEPPSQDDLVLWSQLPSGGEGPYDLITAPVVADPKGVGGSQQAVRANQFPVLLLVDTALKVAERIEPPVEEAAVAAIRAAVAGE